MDEVNNPETMSKLWVRVWFKYAFSSIISHSDSIEFPQDSFPSSKAQEMAGQRGTGSIRLLLYAYRTLGFLGDLLGLKCALVKYPRLTLNFVVGCNWNYQIISLLSYSALIWSTCRLSRNLVFESWGPSCKAFVNQMQRMPLGVLRCPLICGPYDMWSRFEDANSFPK